jgi:hypothetical protein
MNTWDLTMRRQSSSGGPSTGDRPAKSGKAKCAKVSDRRWLAIGLAAFSCLWIAPAGRAQSAPAEQGKDTGNYNIQETIEFGYRLNEVSGNENTYDTFVNLGSGVRLFDYTLNMRSLNHQGLFFDTLTFTNFGYGGDPNDVSRLHVDKNKWYNFDALFRRDKNFWDYNLWANPLNPAAPTAVGSQTSGCIVSPPSALRPGLPGYCSNPSLPSVNSPQEYDLVRRMQDYDVTLLPQSRVRFRLGFSHDREEGPGFFTTDSGSVPDFPETYSYTTNSYHAGVDFHLLPRTTISYDQFFTGFEQNNSVLETPAATPQNYGYQLANGKPVDLGIVWSTLTPAEALPCAAPIANAATNPPTASSVCNGFLSYSQVGEPHNRVPTERLRFQTNYFKKLEMTGTFGYSNSDNKIPNFDEILNGFVTRSSTLESTTAGPAEAKRVSVNADWSGSYSVTDKFRIEDTFRFDNWRIPGMWATYETNIFGAAGTGTIGLGSPFALFNQVAPTTASPFATLCPAPYSQAGCPVHTSSSGADVTNELSYQFLGQDLKTNTIEAEYDFTKRWTGRLGYLYTARSISQFSATFDTGETYFPGGTGASAANDFLAARGDCALVAGALPAGCTLNSDGSVTEGSPTNLVAEAGNDTSFVVTNIRENAAVLGFSGRPVDALSITGDFVFGYNSNSFTRVDPRQMQTYKVHTTYRPKVWATLDGAVDLNENRNDVAFVANLEHDRMYSFSAMLSPNQRLAVGFGYNYWNVYTQSEICFNYSITYTNPAGGTLPVSTSPPGVATTPCPVPGASVGAAGLGTLSTYNSNDHFAHASLMYKPIPRVTTTLGYSGSIVRGNTTFLNPLAPSGTLDYNYVTPYASIAIDIYRGFAYKMGWNYYGFAQEGNTSPFGLAPIPLQNFNGSNATFSFRYSF